MNKNINFIWISRRNKPIPEKCLKWVEAWKLMYGDWKVRVWRNNDIAGLNDPLLNGFWDDNSIHEAQVSNRMRLRIVYLHGGIYADIDTEPIKRIDSIIENSKHNIVVGLTQSLTKDLNRIADMNIFYAEEGCKVLKDVLDKFPIAVRGNRPINEYIANQCSNSVTLLTWRYFHDYRITPQTYTLHWPHRMASWVN